ncbi:hypothetical protein ACFL6S_30620, partial [Candidatus Poribacteria bacterium]
HHVMAMTYLHDKASNNKGLQNCKYVMQNRHGHIPCTYSLAVAEHGVTDFKHADPVFGSLYQ